MFSLAQSYRTWQNPPVAKKTMIAGFTPRSKNRRRPHAVAVVAFDGVVLGDLATACEVFGLARTKDGSERGYHSYSSTSIGVMTQGKSRMRQFRMSGSARGAAREGGSYRDKWNRDNTLNLEL